MRDDADAGTRTRWWPAIVTVAAGIAGFVWVWTSDGDRTGQERVYLSMAIVLGVLILLGLWLTLFSALRRRTRVRALVIILAVFALAAGTVRVRGVTGDLVPILEWRWAARPAERPDALPPAADARLLAPSTPAPAAPAPSTAAASTPAPPSAAAASDRPRPAVVPERDYPQFLGPDRTGVVPAMALATDWKKSPPKLLWRRRVGAGWSGFAVASGMVVTQEQRGTREMVVAYDVADGSPRWSHGDETRYETTVAGEGPRATPTIDRGRVFTLGSTGVLNALDLATGTRIWRRDIGADNESPMPDWGRSSSPLVLDDLVIVSAGSRNGRALAAYHRDSGAPVWSAGSDVASYSSPQLATLAGVRQVVMMHHTLVYGHDPSTGRVLWEHPWPRAQPSVAQPLVLPGDRVLFSAGYGIGSRLLQIASDGAGGLRASLLWESTRMKAKFTNLVVHDGFVYGLDDGVLACLDPATGERRWRSGRYGHGQVILTGGFLLVQTEEGEVVMVEPRPDEPRELTRFPVFTRKTWNPPALAGRYLFVRNDLEAAAYELPLRAR
jgi:outer membrane protein assembly factor BamB